jgi:hypothetical protein
MKNKVKLEREIEEIIIKEIKSNNTNQLENEKVEVRKNQQFSYDINFINEMFEIQHCYLEIKDLFE